MQPKQFNAILTHYSPKVDNSFRLSFTTGELDGDAVKEIHDRFYKQNVWVVIADRELTNDDLLKDAPPLPTLKSDRDEKSASQRLRACLYRLWEGSSEVMKKDGLETSDFETFYQNRMNALIGSVKIELNSLNDRV